jgi:non-specific serine/threonine protein kinase
MFNFFPAPSSSLSELTPRERQVAELIARGYTNPQIAAELTITRETAKTHVSHILWKLGMRSRADVRLMLAGHRVERAD